MCLWKISEYLHEITILCRKTFHPQNFTPITHKLYQNPIKNFSKCLNECSFVRLENKCYLLLLCFLFFHFIPITCMLRGGYFYSSLMFLLVLLKWFSFFKNLVHISRISFWCWWWWRRWEYRILRVFSVFVMRCDVMKQSNIRILPYMMFLLSVPENKDDGNKMMKKKKEQKLVDIGFLCWFSNLFSY